MINEPPIDVLTDNLGDKYKGSKYVLCVIAASDHSITCHKAMELTIGWMIRGLGNMPEIGRYENVYL